MRIISKFKDYYDGLQDPQDSLIYHRLTQTVDLKKEEFTVKQMQWTGSFLSKKLFSCPELFYSRKDKEIGAAHLGVIGFAGKLYPFAQVTIKKSTPLLTETIYIDYNTENYSYYTEQEYKKHKYRYTSYGNYKKECIKKYNHNIEELNVFQNTFALYKCPVFAVYTESVLTYQRKTVFELNPNLSKFSFQKVFDAYSAYQELDMWLGNQAYPGNTMVEIQDKDKVIKHGFDKMSFRKGKEK